MCYEETLAKQHWKGKWDILYARLPICKRKLKTKFEVKFSWMKTLSCLLIPRLRNPRIYIWYSPKAKILMLNFLPLQLISDNAVAFKYLLSFSVYFLALLWDYTERKCFIHFHFLALTDENISFLMLLGRPKADICSQMWWAESMVLGALLSAANWI